jgi:FlaA1/EpsC-like NDP-sugar epimerase
MRFHQCVDAGLFAAALWVAHYLRFHWSWGRPTIFPFADFLWLWVVILPLAPLVLESQGFYNRQLIIRRRSLAWSLLRGSVVMAAVVVFAMFLFREQLARAVFFLFGPVAFLMVWVKEELLWVVYRSRFGQTQLKKRVVLMASNLDLKRIQSLINTCSKDSVAVVAHVDLQDHAISHLMQVIHEHSANGVVIHARHAVFEQVEKAIQACELEGVECWLVADFIQTRVSRTSLDDFFWVASLGLSFHTAGDLAGVDEAIAGLPRGFRAAGVLFAAHVAG